MAENKPTGKIFEIGEKLSLAGLHMNLYFKNRNWHAECVALKERELTDLKKWLPYVQDGALMLKIPTEESPVVLEHFPQLPTAVRWLETADSLILENGQWWPRLYSYETLRNLVITRFRDLDISLDAYVIGANHMGRVAAAVTALLGFSRIHLVDEDMNKLAKEAEVLRRYLFGVKIETIPAQALTVQERPGSLMLNTLKLQDDSAVLGDLSYFNFMKTGGVVVDFSECTMHNRLLEEAQRADLKTLSGLEVQAHLDASILMKLFPGEYITYEDYFESFSDNLQGLKNSSSV